MSRNESPEVTIRDMGEDVENNKQEFQVLCYGYQCFPKVKKHHFYENSKKLRISSNV